MSKEQNEFESWIEQDDKRVETRLVALIRLFVEVESADPESGEPPEIIQCETLDLSANGIQANTPVALPVGAILPIIVQYEDKRFRLMTEIKWSNRPEEQDSNTVWSTGFLLMETDDSDLVAWKEAIVGWLAG